MLNRHFSLRRRYPLQPGPSLVLVELAPAQLPGVERRAGGELVVLFPYLLPVSVLTAGVDV
jgi:hypothetical protein